jgi:crotonobetainyl-CoA:carnitine CoA-transferase CaiB-like acyl-CoA transferase
MLDKELLEGIKILDFTMNSASSLCTRILADMGAEILKIERGPLGDPSRVVGVSPVDGSNAIFLHCNVRKKSLCVNLRNIEGVNLVKRLVPHVDAVVEGFTPGQSKSYGVDYESLRLIKPDIVYCSLSGYGQYGPYRDRVAVASVISAMGGMTHMTGERDGPPLQSPDNADANAAINGTIAVLAAILCHQRTGIGQHVDTSMLDSEIFISPSLETVAANEGMNDPQRLGRESDLIVPQRTFDCKGEYVQLQVVMSGELSMWGRFCKAIGRPDMITDPRFDTPSHRCENRDETIRIIQEWFDRQPSASEAVEYLQKHRVPCGEVKSPRQIFFDPNTRERELVRKVYHPEIDRETSVVFTPYKFYETPIRTKSGAPLLGQHNEEILKEYLSCTDDQIQEWYSDEIIYQDPRVPELRARKRI